MLEGGFDGGGGRLDEILYVGRIDRVIRSFGR